MARYADVPRDLSRVKTKVAFNLTKRQLFFFGTGALIGVPVYFFLRSFLDQGIAVLGMIAVMMPAFFLAMYEKNGQPADVYAKHFIEANFLRPKIRPYKTRNYYALITKQYDLETEVMGIVQNCGNTKKLVGQKGNGRIKSPFGSFIGGSKENKGAD